MAMKVKAVEKLLKFDKNSAGVYRYVIKACERKEPPTSTLWTSAVQLFRLIYTYLYSLELIAQTGTEQTLLANASLDETAELLTTKLST